MTPAFWVAMCITVLPNNEASVSLTRSRALLVYMSPHSSLVQKRVVLLSSCTLYMLQQVFMSIWVENIAKKPTALPNRMLVCVKTYLQDVVVHLLSVAINAAEKRGSQVERSVTDIVAVTRNKEESPYCHMVRHEEIDTIDNRKWNIYWLETPTFVENTPTTVKKSWTSWFSFCICKMAFGQKWKGHLPHFIDLTGGRGQKLCLKPCWPNN